MADLEFRSVTKSFGDNKVLDNISFVINSGELFVLLGPSGCGKSTILRLIAGLENTDSGEILIDNKPVNNISPRNRDVAMVFQNYALYPHMTIYDNLAFPLKVKKVNPEKIREKVESQAQLLGLNSLLERKPRTLSGGQRQRVALGRALVRDPKIFLFDEPLSNLDAKLRVSTRAEIAALQDKLKATMVYVTHDQEEALSLGMRIAVLNQGILQQVDTPRSIYEKPANLFCASFVGSPRINILEGCVKPDGSIFISENFTLKIKDQSRLKGLKQDSKIKIGIRPEDISLQNQNHDTEFKIRFYHSEYAGDRCILFGEIADQKVRVKSGKVSESQSLSQTTAFLNSDDCHLFESETEKRIN